MVERNLGCRKEDSPLMPAPASNEHSFSSQPHHGSFHPLLGFVLGSFIPASSSMKAADFQNYRNSSCYKRCYILHGTTKKKIR
jgi:hypothetical protein